MKNRMRHLKIILSSPLLLLLLLVFNPVKAWGQAVPASPDCGPIFVNSTLTAGSPATISYPAAGFDNRTTGCNNWTFMYQATATSGAFTSISLQNAGGAVVAGTFADWTGTVVTGTNPGTNQTDAIATFSNGCVNGAECNSDHSWVKVLLTRNTFVGTINGVFYGYKTGPELSVTATVVPAGIQAVDGPTAAGVPPTTPPVLVAGQDGAPGNIRTIKTDSGGQQIVLGAQTANSTAVWTSATPQDTTLTLSVVNYANVAFSFTKVAPITTGVVTFEGSVDGVTFVPVSVVLIGSSTTGATTVDLSIQGNSLWQMFVGGLSVFRLRLSTAIVGAGSATFNLAGSVIGTEFQQVVTQGSGLSLHTNVDALPGSTTAQADGATNSPMQPVASVSGTAIKEPTYPYKFNSATWDRDFACTNQALVTIAAGTDAVIVTGVAATNVRICHLDFASDAAATFTIRQGTGSTCGTNTASLAGPYPTIGNLAMDYGATSALRTTVAARDVCIHSGSSVTIGGVVIYAQF